MQNIQHNLAKVTTRVQAAAAECGREGDAIAILAVSKTKTAEDLRNAYQSGQRLFGENYLQEALEKQTALQDLSDIEWHFIGAIQSNKTRALAEQFDWVHSVDRLKIARRLNQHRPAERGPLNICLQINIDNEDSKAGVLLDQLKPLAVEVAQLPNLILRGLMAIPKADASVEQRRSAFASLARARAELAECLPKHNGCDVPPLMDTLSMGMSADLELAIAEGATIVRIGTDIFGPRQPSVDNPAG